ncbi:MAG: MFS transporter, partial [Methanospirillum sp.]|nr:MFS transporter [Methanospirillum sp.]
LRAVIADRIHISKRGTAFGIFNTVYGAGFFIGGVLVGWAYENYQEMAPIVPAFVSVLACGVFFMIKRDIG